MNGIKVEVEEKGLSHVSCLICLQSISSNVFNKEHLNSLNSFLSYLEISEEFKALFICPTCEKDITKLLKLCTILEKVKLEMDYLLEFIKNAVSKSNGKTSCSFSSARDAITRKCGQKLSKPKPVISLQKLDISKYMRKQTPIIDNSDNWFPDWDDVSTSSDSDSDACEKPLTSAIKQEINFDQEQKPTITNGKTLSLNSTQFPCKLCKKTFKNRQGVRKHQVVHRAKIFKCESCDKRYKTAPCLRRHVSFIHKHYKRYCRAPGCEKSFAHRVPPSHYKLEHPGFIVTRMPHPNTSTEYLDKYTVIDIKGNEVMECKFCRKRYQSRNSVVQHFKAVHGFKNMKCQDCNYSTTLKANLKRHVSIWHKN